MTRIPTRLKSRLKKNFKRIASLIGLRPSQAGTPKAPVRSDVKTSRPHSGFDEIAVKAAFNNLLLQNINTRYMSTADILRAVDLGVTAKATGISSDLDLHGASFQFTMQAACSAAAAAGETLFIYIEGEEWKDMSNAKLANWNPTILRHGFVEIAISDPNKRLIDRFSINIWTNDGEVLLCTNPHAPIKRTRKGVKFQDDHLDTKAKPIDIVYTWVNASDPEWRKMIGAYREQDEIDLDRYAQIDELKYSLRSIFTFAPWLRRVHIFTNCAAPEWFIESDRVKWVQHEHVISDRYLPLFNSHSIEMFLHEIPELADQYIYFNDDVFASYFLRPQDFFTPYGQSISRMETHGSTPHFSDLVESGAALEWQSAALNCSELFNNWIGVFPTNLHRHTPHAFCKSTYAALVQQFPAAAELTRNSRFRAATDYSFTSFLYHHYALATGKAMRVTEEGAIVRSSNYRSFQRRKSYLKTRFFCLNDGGGSAKDANFQQFKGSFLEERFIFKSPAER